MYKTVRKGDASLQYTILPQTDQFNAPGFVPATSKARPRALKFTMALVVLLIIMSCVATPFLINQKDHNLFASTMLSMGRVDHSLYKNVSKTNSKDLVVEKEREVEFPKFGVEVERRDEPETTSSKPDNNLAKNIPRTSDPSTSSSSQSPTTTTSVPNQHQSSSQFSPTYGSSTSQSLTKLSTDIPRKLPKVTLKLRENETIPQMYMKAGIASYKKGNITTSVLAHGLSLEGLIFKTPEGTIKPWPQKWPFSDPSSYFQWKGIRQVPRMVTFVLAGLLALATVSVILLTYIQWKASRRQRGNVEVHEIESQEEDESTLLGPETSETVDKEGQIPRR